MFQVGIGLFDRQVRKLNVWFFKGIFIILTKTSHERALQTGSPYEGNLYLFGKNIALYAKGAYLGRPRNSPTKAD